MSDHDTTEQVRRAQRGDLEAFNGLVRRFQDMAVAYAVSRTGDFHTAQDAAQEAFVEAFRILPTLRTPAAFLVWFRRLILKHCDRATRRKRVETISLDAAEHVPSIAPSLDEMLVRQQTETDLVDLLRGLPEGQQVVLTLFYLGGQSHREIAAFLDLPVSTVKSRLHQGRSRIKERINIMENDMLQEQRPSRDDAFIGQVNQNIAQAVAGVAAGAGPGSVYHDPHPVFQLTVSLLLWAIDTHASEISFLPEEGRMPVQLTVDGKTRTILSLPHSLREPMTVRLKVMADLTITPDHGAQEGMIPIVYQERDYAAYVMTQPAENGEFIRVRLYYPPSEIQSK